MVPTKRGQLSTLNFSHTRYSCTRNGSLQIQYRLETDSSPPQLTFFKHGESSSSLSSPASLPQTTQRGLWAHVYHPCSLLSVRDTISRPRLTLLMVESFKLVSIHLSISPTRSTNSKKVTGRIRKQSSRKLWNCDWITL